MSVLFSGFIKQFENRFYSGYLGFDGYADRWVFVIDAFNTFFGSGSVEYNIHFMRNRDGLPSDHSDFDYIVYFETESPIYSIEKNVFEQYQMSLGDRFIAFTWDIRKVDNTNVFYLPYSANICFSQAINKSMSGVAVFRPGFLSSPINYLKRVYYFRRLLSIYNKKVDIYGQGWKLLDRVIWKIFLLGYQVDFIAKSVDNKIETLEKYEDYICFENEIDEYYISEKIVDGIISECNVYYSGGNLDLFNYNLGLDLKLDELGMGLWSISRLTYQKKIKLNESILNNKNLSDYILGCLRNKVRLT